ncbi:MAG: hypothetical protein ABSE22_13435 [Xanthobacteraceae bacterium]|jgi:hypothetical protein
MRTFILTLAALVSLGLTLPYAAPAKADPVVVIGGGHHHHHDHDWHHHRHN